MRFRLAITGGAALLSTTAIQLFCAPLAGAQIPSRCVPAAPTKQALAAPARAKVTPIKPGSRTLKANLGSDSKSQTRTFSITTPPLEKNREVLAELDGDLENADNQTLAANQASVTPSVTTLGDISLIVCLDPAVPERVGPGRYLGAISIGGPGIETTSYPLEVTVQASGWIAFLWIALGTLLGIILKMFADLQKAPNVDVSFGGIGKYIKQGVFFFAIVTGIVAGIVNFLGIYEPDLTWGSPLDEVKVFVAAVALQATGMTLTDVIKPFQPPPAA